MQSNKEQNFFELVDWPLFYQQKLAVLALIDKMQGSNDKAYEHGAEWLQGVLTLMDFMGDEAEKCGLFTYPEMDEAKQRFKDDRYNDILDKLPMVSKDTSSTNTRVDYLYRDGSNYKMHSNEIVRGAITPEQVEQIKNSLIDGEYFYPADVGLPENRFEPSYEDDPDWFELSFDGNFEHTTQKATIDLTVEQLVNNFQRSAAERKSAKNTFSCIVTLKRTRPDLRKPESWEDDFIMEIEEDAIIDGDICEYAKNTFYAMAHELLTSKEAVQLFKRSSEDFNWGDFISELTYEVQKNHHCYFLNQASQIQTQGNQIWKRVIVDVWQDEVLLLEEEPCSIFVNGKKVGDGLANMCSGAVVPERMTVIPEGQTASITFEEGGKATFSLAIDEETKNAVAKQVNDVKTDDYFWLDELD